MSVCARPFVRLLVWQLHKVWKAQIDQLRTGTDSGGSNSLNDAAQTSVETPTDMPAAATGDAAATSAADEQTAADRDRDAPAASSAVESDAVAAAATSGSQSAAESTTETETEAVDSEAVAETPGKETAETATLDLEDKDAVQQAPFLEVIESLTLAMTKHYLSELLPPAAVDGSITDPAASATGGGDTDANNADTGGGGGGEGGGFSSARRAQWVDEMVRTGSIGTACQQVPPPPPLSLHLICPKPGAVCFAFTSRLFRLGFAKTRSGRSF